MDALFELFDFGASVWARGPNAWGLSEGCRSSTRVLGFGGCGLKFLVFGISGVGDWSLDFAGLEFSLALSF